jgi:hypothetical protein
MAGWLVAAVLFGCSAAPEPSNPLPGEGGTGGSSTGGVSGVGGTIPVSGTGGVGVRDPNDTRDLPVRKKTCDASGMNCTCLRLALLGTLDSAAAQKDTTPFVTWLNGNSDGTATVTMVTTKPTVDQAFLANYDILLVANVNGWTFSAAEKDAVHEWMLETGGGMITLTGFDSTAGEPVATSQLIESAGFAYVATRTAEGGQGRPVYYQGGTTDLKNCVSWSGNPDAVITTPIPFVSQTGSMERLTFELDYVSHHGSADRGGARARGQGTSLRLRRRVGHLQEPVGAGGQSVQHADGHVQSVLASGGHRRRHLLPLGEDALSNEAVLVRRRELGRAAERVRLHHH